MQANYPKTIYLNKAKGKGKHANKDLGTQNIPRYKQQKGCICQKIDASQFQRHVFDLEEKK